MINWYTKLWRWHGWRHLAGQAAIPYNGHHRSRNTTPTETCCSAQSDGTKSETPASLLHKSAAYPTSYRHISWIDIGLPYSISFQPALNRHQHAILRGATNGDRNHIRHVGPWQRNPSKSLRQRPIQSQWLCRKTNPAASKWTTNIWPATWGGASSHLSRGWME